MASDVDRAHVRMAELIAALSLGIDLGFGQPMEHVLRQCLIALRLAERIGLDEDERAVVYYTALLINVGCHTDAHEQAKWFGDDIALKSAKYDHEPRQPAHGRVAACGASAPGSPPLHRFRLGLEFALSGHREVDGMIEHHAAIAPVAGRAARAARTRCSTRSAPPTRCGTARAGRASSRATAVPIAARLAQLAEYVEVAHRVGGVDAARALARERARQAVRPVLADLLRADAEMVLAGLDTVGTWDAVIDAEPALAIVLSGERFDAALVAIANFVDLKSPYTLGHARAVADLAADAAAQLGLGEGEVRTLRRAGLVHDLGRLGVSNAIWDKPGPLGAGEWERVRLHPYLTERMLHQSEALAPLGAIAVQHRERLDGSGYPRGLSGAAISRPARVLGAADAYQAMREPRPYRPALAPGEAAAAAARRGQGRAARRRGGRGRAGRRRPPRRRAAAAGPAGLTRAKSRSSGCSPAACPTGRSPSSS